jgi:hypothetical protein
MPTTTTDRAQTIMRAFAAKCADDLHVSEAFIWIDMNWQALVPWAQALLDPKGGCRMCGRHVTDAADVQLTYCVPPRHDHDWARYHARNIWIGCAACIATKGDTPFAVWLDERHAMMPH